MDISDRIEFRDSLVIAEHLVYAFGATARGGAPGTDDWICELCRRACDEDDAVARRHAAIKAVHLYHAFVARVASSSPSASRRTRRSPPTQRAMAPAQLAEGAAK